MPFIGILSDFKMEDIIVISSTKEGAEKALKKAYYKIKRDGRHRYNGEGLTWKEAKEYFEPRVIDVEMEHPILLGYEEDILDNNKAVVAHNLNED